MIISESSQDSGHSSELIGEDAVTREPTLPYGHPSELVGGDASTREPTPPYGHPSELVGGNASTREPTPPSGHPSQEGSGSLPYFIAYKPHLKELAHQLRQNMTPGEAILWQRLKRKQMCGYDFDRQRPIDEYIVDFYCKKLMLAIEVDGSSHDGETAQQNDYTRQARLESLGVRFLRFSENQVCNQINTVLHAIRTWIVEHPPEKSPPGRGARRAGWVSR